METNLKPLEVEPGVFLTEEHFENVIVTALEGGSNYWYYLADEELGHLDHPFEPISSEIARKLFTDDSYVLRVRDLENPEEILGTISQAELVNAFRLAKDQFPEVYDAEIDTEDYSGDALTADILFQLAVIKEVIFG